MEEKEYADSLFCCPICARALTRKPTAYCCPNGHSFDRAAAGYVHLLPVNRMHSKAPGDDKGMAAARNRFLSGGYYEPLRSALEKRAISAVGQAPSVLDSGCGEGYYTAGVYRKLADAGLNPRMAGVDISKFALRWAGKREPRVEFAVASAYGLPVGDESVDLLLNCFSPLGLEEFARVLKPGGILMYVVPSPKHLWELKCVLYAAPYENQRQEIPYPGFSCQSIDTVEETIHLEGQETIHDLFQMTPYYWRTPKEGAQRLERLEQLDTQIAFDLHVFRRD